MGRGPGAGRCPPGLYLQLVQGPGAARVLPPGLRGPRRGAAEHRGQRHQRGHLHVRGAPAAASSHHLLLACARARPIKHFSQRLGSFLGVVGRAGPPVFCRWRHSRAHSDNWEQSPAWAGRAHAHATFPIASTCFPPQENGVLFHKFTNQSIKTEGGECGRQGHGCRALLELRT